jgi:5-methylcytosine-specific restriction endonuclease McrA
MTKYEKKVCDRLWQIKITGGICSFPGCNRTGNEGHHAVARRRYLNTRWDIKNGRALCRDHHLWADTHPEEYAHMILMEIGAVEYETLRLKSQEVVKHFYDEILEGLK